MATIVYLDADDEITSAATRIRVANEKRIALVVPYGSRLATSRINFRLLAREAQARGHRLSVVAGDAATRALAASAGLPVFGSVGEYEDSETTRPGREPEGVAPARLADEHAAPDPEETQVVALPVATRSGPNGGPVRTVAPAGAGAGPGVGAATVAVAATGSRTLGGRGTRLAWPYGQTAAIATAALIGLALLALAVGAFLLLPSATATVAVERERIGPLPMEIRADPEATEPNVETGVIPAQRLTFDVAVSGLFPTTGVRVEATRARGEVRFLSKNPVDVNNVGVGAIVSTPNGIQFRTTARLVIPKATIVGLTVIPGEASVAVEAVEAGPGGNVAAQAITVVPANEDPTFTEVRNPEPTGGGSQLEFPRVEQTDIDAALTQLDGRLDAEFATILADPARVPPGLTMFGASRQLVEPLPTTDPATLLGQEIAEFPLGLATTGTVMAVDPGPVESLATSRIEASVTAGYRLVDGSIRVTPGEPVVTGEMVSFPVSATAAQIRVVDPDALRDAIKGKSIADARAILGSYGEVQLTVWPEWVSAIPTLDGRLDIRVEMPAGVEGPSGSPRPSGASGSPIRTAAPSSSASGSPSLPAASPAGPTGSVDPGLGGESPPP